MELPQNPTIEKFVGPDLYQLQDEYDSDVEYQKELYELVSFFPLQKIQSKHKTLYKAPEKLIEKLGQLNSELIDLFSLKILFNILGKPFTFINKKKMVFKWLTIKK